MLFAQLRMVRLREALVGYAASVPSLRLSISFVLAWCLATGMFWFLWSFIAVREGGQVVAAVPRIDFSRLKADSELQEVKRVKPQIEKPAPPPSATTVSASKTVSVTAGIDSASLAPSGVDFGAGSGGGIAVAAAALAFGTGSDRDAVPQVRIEPDYPPNARSRRVEGWVEVEFDVGRDGSTRNARVTAAQPQMVFEQATLRAIAGWKYSPMIEDGKPVERKGIKVRLVFDLDR
jgi:protein TonB